MPKKYCINKLCPNEKISLTKKNTNNDFGYCDPCFAVLMAPMINPVKDGESYLKNAAKYLFPDEKHSI